MAPTLPSRVSGQAPYGIVCAAGEDEGADKQGARHLDAEGAIDGSLQVSDGLLHRAATHERFAEGEPDGRLRRVGGERALEERDRLRVPAGLAQRLPHAELQDARMAVRRQHLRDVSPGLVDGPLLDEEHGLARLLPPSPL